MNQKVEKKTAAAKKTADPLKVEGAPASRTLYRNAESGMLVTAEEAAREPKLHVAEVLEPNYKATVVTSQPRADGVRLVLDVDLPATQVDVLRWDGAQVRVGVSV